MRIFSSSIIFFSLLLLISGTGLLGFAVASKSELFSELEVRDPAFSGYVPSSCTIFTVTKGGKVFFGNNEDYYPRGTYAWFLPSQEIVTPSGNITTNGVVYFGFDNNNLEVDGWPQGGMNHLGLCFDVNSLPTVDKNPHEDREHLYTRMNLQVLWECGTIDEVIDWFESHYLWDQFGGQFHFADATGDAVVVGVGADGELKYTRIGNSSYLVSTNFNLANPSNLYGSLPCWRYDTACSMLDEITSEEDLTVEACRDILDAVHQKFGSPTRYSNIFDLVQRDIYIYHNHNFKRVVQLNLDVELAKVIPGAEGVETHESDVWPWHNLPVIYRQVKISDYFPLTPMALGLIIGLPIGVVTITIGTFVTAVIVLRRRKKTKV